MTAHKAFPGFEWCHEVLQLAQGPQVCAFVLASVKQAQTTWRSVLMEEGGHSQKWLFEMKSSALVTTFVLDRMSFPRNSNFHRETSIRPMRTTLFSCLGLYRWPI